MDLVIFIGFVIVIVAMAALFCALLRRPPSNTWRDEDGADKWAQHRRDKADKYGSEE